MSTDLYEVKANVLVERVESKLRQSMIAPRSMHKQQLVEKSELRTNMSRQQRYKQAVRLGGRHNMPLPRYLDF